MEKAMLKTIRSHRSAFAFLAFCSLSFLSLNTSAQSIDTGVLTVKGSVQISTCRVNFRNQGQSEFSANPVLDLGNFKVSDFELAEASIGNPREVTRNPPKVMVVSLSSTNNQNQSCTLGGGQKWDLQISDATTGAVGEGLGRFLKSPSGTDALVGIKGAVLTNINANEATFNNFLDVSDRTINVGTGTTSFRATNTNGIAIRAAFISVSPTGPTPGIFESPITLMAVYQ
jgi:type 1 fimbria pilin